MSNTTAAQQQPSDPDSKSHKRLEIPAWWALVALVMAGLVFLPIQYEKTHNIKTSTENPQAKETAAPAETQVKAAAAEEGTPPKPAVAEATEAKANVEQAEQGKPAAAEAVPAAPAVKPSEQVKPAATETKPAVAEAKPAAEEAKPAAVEAKPVAQEAQPAEAKPAAAEAKPAPVEAAKAKPAAAETKPAAAEAKPAAVEQAKKPAEKQKVADALVFRVDGKDKQGRAAAFDFIVLTNAYVWAKGSTNQIVSGGKVIPETEVAGRLFSQQVRDSLSSATDLIAVGLASKDGKRADEEARAAARSKTAAAWIAKAGKPDLGVWTLTLGQYKGCKQQEDKDSSFDRPVIFAGVRSKEEGANLQEALADAISGHDNLPGRDCYSRFDLEKVR